MIRYINNGKTAVAEEVAICTTADVLDLLADAYYGGANSIIVQKDAFPDDFYVLKTGLAGEILQKFSNYGMRLAIIGNFNTTSESLAAFIRECNRGQTVLFAETFEAAANKLTK
jgi:hypothetical protein